MELDVLVENSTVTSLAWREEGREEKRDGGSGSKASWGEWVDHRGWRRMVLAANDDDEWRPGMRW